MTFRVTRKTLSDYGFYARNGRVVAFDTETTGISCDDEIVQIAAAEYVCGELTRTFCLYVVPSCPISPGAAAVNHLTLPFLAENGVSPCEALERFFAFLGQDVLLVAHNIRFDYRMLQGECRKFDYTAELQGVSFCDTIALAKKLVPGLEHYRLGWLVDAMGLSGRNSHDALDDTLACGELFFELMRRSNAMGGCKED